MEINIHFLGAAGTVTGSKYLIQTDELSFMVDCGLFQGVKNLRIRNWESLSVDVSGIKFILLTHAHLDHTGYIPKIVKDGFSGRILCNAPTRALTEIILRDSARIQEEEAMEANQKGYSAHFPAKPLYTSNEVEKSLGFFEIVQNDVWIPLGNHISCRWRYNGHILGACFLEIKINEKIIVFSGDIGRKDDPILFDPQLPEKADILFIESTYGNRLHPIVDPAKELNSILKYIQFEKKILIIPGFAIERVQLLLHYFSQLKKENNLHGLNVFMDSPMGNKVLDAFIRFSNWQKADENYWRSVSETFRLITSFEESKSVCENKNSKVVIAGSGMVTGGRVLSYLERYISSSRAVFLLTGYQAEGTRGRRLLDGEHEIKLKGKYLKVKARIMNLQGLSAHADQRGLLQWLQKIKNKPEMVFITHGEPSSADALRVKIKDQFKWNVSVPEFDDKVKINI